VLLGAADRLLEELGVALEPADVIEYNAYVARIRPQLDDVEWEAAREEGRAMTTEQAIEYALEQTRQE
jgi:hypothetical protein